MKKVLLVLALVAAYGVSMAMSGADINSVNIDQVMVVADVDDNNDAEPEKEKAKTTEATTAKSKAAATTTAKSDGCATAKSEGCATKKSEGCGGDKAEAKKEDSK